LIKNNFIELESLKNIVREAGKIILEIRNKNLDLNIEYKDDNSLLTIADKLSNKYILKELSRTKIPILSEENITKINSSSYWIIDPLDGTKDYVNGSNHFTVNIALIKNGKPVIGLIFAPALDELFVRYFDSEKYSIIRGNLIEFSNSNNRSSARILRSKDDLGKIFESLKYNFDSYVEKKISSSLKFGYLSINKFNTYIRTIGSSEWDIAAGHALLLGNGGDIFDLNTMRTINYNKRNYRNHGFIAVNSTDNQILNNLIK
jgi:3'(2'), 5'-bisphosphate nucleotidase